MESQILTHPHDDYQEPQTVEDQHQEGGEKKSVMRRVKDKAKKIRESIKKRGQHGHDPESDEMKTPPEDHDLDEEDTDSDEEVLEDPAAHGPPEIHGPPMYESGAGTDAQRSQPEELSRSGVSDERRREGKGKVGDLGRTGGTGTGEFLETPQNTPVQSFQSQEATFAPARATVESPEQRKVHLEIPRGMEEDHAAPPTAKTDQTSNYQSKVTDSAVHGRTEIHGAPMYESVAGTAAQARQPEELSRPRIADERLARGDEGMKRPFPGGEGKSKGGDLRRAGEFFETPQSTPVPSSHLQEATFAPATATVESPEQRKVHMEIPSGMEEDPAAPTAITDGTSNYQSKVTDPTGKGEEVRDFTPMIRSFEKLGMRDEQNRGEKQSTSAGGLPLPTGSHDQFKPEAAISESQEEKSPSQGGYMSSIASTAASLRTSLMSRVVGSGTASETETVPPETGTDKLQESEGGKPKQPSVVEPGKEKIGPVYEKAAGAGTGVLSEIVGPGNQANQETMEVDSGAEGDEISGEDKIVQDKGMSVGSYMSEKLKPGEEDEALSEAISEKLMKNREETYEDGKEGSDDPVKGGMVDKLRGVVGSWFSKPGEPQPIDGSGTSNEALEQKMGLGEEEKQLQKSSN